MKALVQKWMRITESNGGSVDAVKGGIIEGASHNLNGQSDEIVNNLLRRVGGYITSLERGDIGPIAGGSRM